MSAFLHGYLVIGLVALLPLILGGSTLLFGRLIRPARPSAQKRLPYESGSDSTGEGWSQPHVRYYLLALLFVVFDVEVAFIVPWAIQIDGLGVYGLVEMLLFVGILVLGLLYAWRKGILRWD